LLHQGSTWIKPEDVENEVRAIKKLCGGGAHTNIVEVLRLGELVGSPYFFIDMELCDLTLEDYIYRNSPVSDSIPQFVRDASSSSKAMQIWNIVKQIASGVTFIHSQDEVHRDLKPRNGTFPLV